MIVVMGFGTINPLACYAQEAEADADESEEMEEGTAQQVERRPLMEEKERAELAAYLREQYSKPVEEWPPMEVDDDVDARELGMLPKPPFPEENPYSKEKAELGMMLFFEPRLSGSQQISCASCHDPDMGWAENRRVSFGVHRKTLQRNAPSILNTAYQSAFFHDGRAATLEQQAQMVIMDPDEMAGNPQQIVERLQKEPVYQEKFAAAFPEEKEDVVNFGNVLRAIATFERTVISKGSRFDAFLSGKHDALSDAAIRGLHLYRTTAGCMNCHHGPNFDDDKFHDIGLSYYGRKFQDLGRYEITKKPEDVGAFRTPTLRNIAATEPYMHLGLFQLRQVLNLYNAGMPTLRPKPEQENDPLFPIKSKHLRPLGLNGQDLLDLEAFMLSLTDRPRRIYPPELPPIVSEE